MHVYSVKLSVSVYFPYFISMLSSHFLYCPNVLNLLLMNNFPSTLLPAQLIHHPAYKTTVKVSAGSRQAQFGTKSPVSMHCVFQH